VNDQIGVAMQPRRAIAAVAWSTSWEAFPASGAADLTRCGPGYAKPGSARAAPDGHGGQG
jgi:hypothetical protein